MFSTYFIISASFLPISAVAASIYHKKSDKTPLKYLWIYLWFVLASEVVGYLLAKKYGINLWWYNTTGNIENLFYFSIFYRYIKNNTAKKILLLGITLYEIFFLIHYIFHEKHWNVYQSLSLTAGSFLIIIAAFIFLIEMFQSDEILYIRKYLIFWISVGVLAYLVVSMPFDISIYYTSVTQNKNGLLLIHIKWTASMIMYFLFTYGYIWSTKRYK